MWRPVITNLELSIARLAEDRDRLLVAESAGIVFQLLVISLVPIGMNDRLEDLA